MMITNIFIEVNQLLSLICFVAILPLSNLTVGKTLHGVRLGDFPPPTFKTNIKAVASQNGDSSFRRVILPSAFTSVPDLVRVYASTEDGDSSGFRFEGTGACQNSGSSGNYGGVIFAYNSKEVYLWAPTKYSGNTNGKLIYVEDGWGGEKYTQSSRVADLTIEAWNSLPTPNFRTEIQVDGSKRFYEVPHNLKQIPDFISVRVYSYSSGIFKKDLLFHFHAAGAVQTPSGSVEYGGVIFAYNEAFVRLWLPTSGNGLQTGCILITRGWGNGKYSKQMNSDVCQVEIRAWINSFPLPAYQTSWKSIRANAHSKSFREIRHDLGKDVLLVQVQVKKEGLRTDHFIYDGLGSIQSTQSPKALYGGVLFAYDKERVRIWVASTSDNSERGRAIFVSNAWGNGSHVEEHDRALFRIRIYANMCKNMLQIVDGQGICRDAKHTGLVWQASPWGNCSNLCTNGIQRKELTGCHATNLKTVFSCNFEQDRCGFTSSFKWRSSRGSEEKELEPDGYTQPPYGFYKGSTFIYSVVKHLPGGLLVHLISPEFPARKNCILRFLYNTGVYFNYITVDVRSDIGWYQAWKLSDKQPGDPYIWRQGYLNLEMYAVKQFRFNLRLQHPCLKHCGYVAFDEVSLQCEAEESTLVSLETCENRAVALPGCGIDILQPLLKGKAFMIVDGNGEKYVRANGTLSQHIATYRFKVEKVDVYTVWIEALGTSFRDNSVWFYIDNHRQQTAHSNIIEAQPAWTWNCLNRKGVYLDSGIHTITLSQYDAGFTYRTIIVSPRRIMAWSSLGMQSMHINDLQLRSSLKIGIENAPHLRLNGKGAWQTMDSNFGFWLHWQINFPDIALVNRIAIQAACHSSGAVRCCGVEKFHLRFSINGKDFSIYMNSTQQPYLFPGSNAQAPNHIVESELEYVVPARAVRIFPYNSISYTCLRLEVYGVYITKQMCTHAGMKPALVRSCVGSRKCGKNAECVRTTDIQDKFGPDCNETCRCSGKSRCHPATGRCICQPGFTSQTCNTPCPNGHFGQDCENICKCSSYTICDPVSGTCYCPTGYYGQFCEHPCKIGFYGRNCSMPCQCARHSECLPKNGTCICPPGWFGRYCDKECPDGKFGPNCQFNCMCRGNSICDKRYGGCTCKVGWRGDKCDWPCRDKWYGLGCNFNCTCNWDRTVRCDHVTGQCICKDGYVGLKCNDPCKHGTYGPGCANRCKCRNDAYCDPKDGQCRCQDGFIGKFCQTPCPKGLYGKNCNSICRCVVNNTQTCNNVDGTCDCLPGFKGKRCRKVCKPGLWGKNCNFECHCHHGSHCDRMDGICTCTAGWVGPTCDTPCHNGFYGPGCKFACNCQNDAICSRFNGSCTCLSGFTGKYCNESCSLWKYGENCERDCSCRRDLAESCSNINGSCFCKPGYRGDNCEENCPDGKYGQGCTLSCQDCQYHSNGSCDKVDGKCMCSPGYYGDLCQDSCPLDSFGRKCSQPCQCAEQDICNNINGECFSRSQFVFYTSIKVGGTTTEVGTGVLTKLAYNIERSMAIHYVSFLESLSRKRREVSVLRSQLSMDPDFEMIMSDDDSVVQEKLSDEEDHLVHRMLEEDRKNNLDWFLGQISDDNDVDGGALLNLGSQDASHTDDRKIFENAESQEISDSDFDHLPHRPDIQNGLANNRRHIIMRRDLTDNNKTLACRTLASSPNISPFSVRVLSKQKKFTYDGKIVFIIGVVALYNSKPQKKQLMDVFMKSLSDGCLLTGTSCNPCSVYYGSLNDGEVTENPLNTWIIVGAASGVFVLCLAFAIYFIVQRKRHSIVPTIYKVKKNSRDIELRPCLANGDGGHVLAFENPYYDVIAAMGLDDDIEEDYYNPLYTYDDVSLYCDDQGSDSGTETNNDDAYQYPYDRDSGISSGTIHQ